MLGRTNGHIYRDALRNSVLGSKQHLARLLLLQRSSRNGAKEGRPWIRADNTMATPQQSETPVRSQPVSNGARIATSVRTTCVSTCPSECVSASEVTLPPRWAAPRWHTASAQQRKSGGVCDHTGKPWKSSASLHHSVPDATKTPRKAGAEHRHHHTSRIWRFFWTCVFQCIELCIPMCINKALHMPLCLCYSDMPTAACSDCQALLSISKSIDKCMSHVATVLWC